MGLIRMLALKPSLDRRDGASVPSLTKENRMPCPKAGRLEGLGMGKLQVDEKWPDRLGTLGERWTAEFG